MSGETVLLKLHRRHVFRATTAYVAASWLLVQVATQVFPYFHIADSVVRWLIFALAGGFPLAMLYAWFRPWTPAADAIDSEVESSPSTAHESGRKLDFWIIGALSLIVVFLLVDAFVPGVDDDVSVAEKSIAVLPLSNVSADDDELYFSDGISENLIAALSQFSGLKVISRNSAFRFRDSAEDSTSIGRKLGVAYLLGGSVRRAAGQVRIIVELIRADDGSTLWSQRYERPYTDLFALQDEIADTVAVALEARLSNDAATVVQSDRPPNGNLDAYNAYLHGQFYDERKSEADYRKAIDYFTAATHLDPQYAAAYAGLAIAWSNLASYYLGGADAHQAYAEGKLAVATALRLDPESARAHRARGWLLQNADMDWIAAEVEFRRALELAPASSEAKSSLGWLLATLGQLSQAIDLTRQSIETDPLHADGYTALAAYLSPLGRLDEAEQAIEKAIELQPEAGWERVQLAIIKIQRGDAKGAQAALREVHDDGGWLEIAQAFVLQMGDDSKAADAALQTLIDTQADVSAFQIAQVYALRKQPDKSLEWLDRALANRDPGISRLWFDPFILRYRDDPRFVAFCRKARLPISAEATPNIPAFVQTPVGVSSVTAMKSMQLP